MRTASTRSVVAHKTGDRKKKVEEFDVRISRQRIAVDFFFVPAFFFYCLFIFYWREEMSFTGYIVWCTKYLYCFVLVAGRESCCAKNDKGTTPVSRALEGIRRGCRYVGAGKGSQLSAAYRGFSQRGGG